MYKQLTFEEYVSKSFDELQDDNTFTAKAHQKRAFENLSHAYDVLTEENQNSGNWWDIPHYVHQIREKHFKFFDEKHHVNLGRLVSLRAMFKDTPIIKPAPKSDRVSQRPRFFSLKKQTIPVYCFYDNKKA